MVVLRFVLGEDPTMATTTIDDASFRAALADAGDAIIVEDWALAQKKLAIAEVINNGLNQSESATGAGGGGSGFQRRESLDRTSALLDKVKASIALSRGEKRRIVGRVGYGA